MQVRGSVPVFNVLIGLVVTVCAIAPLLIGCDTAGNLDGPMTDVDRIDATLDSAVSVDGDSTHRCEGPPPTAAGLAGICVGAVSVCGPDGTWIAPGPEALADQIAAFEPTEITCDGLDNDCDGDIDEDLGETTCGVGQCAHTRPQCQHGRITPCDARAGASEEICDGVDNDCDGETDENQGRTTCGVGPCQHTVDRCAGGRETTCDPAEGAIPEICDGVDNDCDGEIDNQVTNACGTCGPAPDEICDGLDNDCDGDIDEALGQASCGLGVCERTIPRCVDGQINLCEPFLGQGPEICDGLDNDCDGETDEALPSLTCGVGACERTVPSCHNGRVMICEPLPPANRERCDGLDNDCDGEIDEDLGEIRCGLGPCRHAIPACESGVVPTCAPLPIAEPEVCDGTDNDCDGQADEGVRNLCGECGPEPDEICDGLDNDCDGAVDEGVTNACGDCGPVPVERCDGTDNDCDGQTDEGLTNRCGDCGPEPQEICDGHDNDCDGEIDEQVLNACGGCGEVRPEICDGTDNDCDGEIDEGVTNACGDCGPLPVEICDGIDNDCNGEIDEGVTNACGDCGPLPPEICDRRDNDCDGEIDEGVTNACGDCGEPPLEICDGIDNDCDAEVDEGVLNACGRCGPTPIEICDGRDNDCDGEIDEQVTNPCGRCGPAPEELCDGIDNDCDGEIDEGVRNVCGGCGPVPVEICDGWDNDCDGDVDDGVLNACGDCGRVPVEICDGRDNDCDDEIDEQVANACGACGEVPPEICDGIDNDCDGQTDEGVTNRCGACGELPAEICDGSDNDCDGQVDEDLGQIECGLGVCHRRVDRCARGQPQLCDPLLGASAEQCDGLDNDCDGVIDEGFGAITCGLGQCVHTVDRCVNGEPRACDPMVGATEEICDGKDNDCDGLEDNDLGRTTCGLGQCRHTVVSCIDGVPQQCDPLAAASDEICDGVDNDCDGIADEQDVCGDCFGIEDGAVLGIGNWSPCQDFDDVCDQTGNRERTVTVCWNGQPHVEIESRPCDRVTDGLDCLVGGICDRGTCVVNRLDCAGIYECTQACPDPACADRCHRLGGDRAVLMYDRMTECWRAQCPADALPDAGAREACLAEHCARSTQTCLAAECGDGMCRWYEDCQADCTSGICGEPIRLDPEVVTVRGSTLEAPSAVSGSCAGRGPEQVYALEVRKPGRLQVLMTGYDTVVHLRSTCNDPTSELACNDDPESDPSSRFATLDVSVVPGSYFLIADSYQSGGEYELTYTVVTDPCADAVCPRDQLCVATPDWSAFACECPPDTVPAGERCVDNPCLGDPCDDGPAHRDRCVPTADGQFTCECAGGYQPDPADPADPANPDAPDGDCVPDSGASADTCDEVLFLPAGEGVVTGSLLDAQNNAVGRCGGAGPERVYGLELVEPRRFSAVMGGFDTLLHLRTRCDDANTELACDDDTYDREAALDLMLEPGTYFLFADAYDAPGDYELRYSLRADPCRDDPCPGEPECAARADWSGFTCRCPAGQTPLQDRCVNDPCDPDPCAHGPAHRHECVGDLATGRAACGCSRGYRDDPQNPEGDCLSDPDGWAEWTFMIVLGADNDLEQNGLNDLAEMERVGSTDQVNIVVLLDTYAEGDGDGRYLYVNPIAEGGHQIVENLGEIDHGSWPAIAEFGVWGIERYPARRYAFILWSHGNGWKSNRRVMPLFKEFSPDEHGSRRGISISSGDYARALEPIVAAAGGKLDLVGFDACLMGMWEVAAASVDFSHAFAASEENIPVSGWSYDDLLAELVAAPEMDGLALGAAVADTYHAEMSYNATLSVVNLDAMVGLRQAVSQLADALVAHPDLYGSFEAERSRSQTFGSIDAYRDLGHFAQRIRRLADAPRDLVDAAAAVEREVQTVVVVNRTQRTHPNALGLSIYFPRHRDRMDPDYRDVGAVWSARTRWDEFLETFTR